MEDFYFTNLLNTEKDGAWCSILRICDIRILLDCGCNESATDSFETVA